MKRRDALKRLGTGGLTVFGAGLVGAVGGHQIQQASADTTDSTIGNITTDTVDTGHDYKTGRLSSELPVGADAGPYGGDYAPPEQLEADDLDAQTFPPPPAPNARSQTIEIEMGVVEVDHQISRTQIVEAWTYNGSAPGPTLRANEGDLLRIHFTNRTSHNHNLHFHGRHSPTQDGWEPVPPGGETVYEIEAGPAGVHPYHCHTMPIDRHIAKGLYGTLIVDPPGGRPVDDGTTEVVLALSGWDVDDDGRNEFYTWNGVSGFYSKFPIKIVVGRKVRAYVLNMVEFDPLASFHLHAEMFDVYPTGIGDRPAAVADVIALGQMERAVIEFTVPERGRYMFHPHQHSMAARGAMGWFSAI